MSQKMTFFLYSKLNFRKKRRKKQIFINIVVLLRKYSKKYFYNIKTILNLNIPNGIIQKYFWNIFSVIFINIPEMIFEGKINISRIFRNY